MSDRDRMWYDALTGQPPHPNITQPLTPEAIERAAELLKGLPASGLRESPAVEQPHDCHVHTVLVCGSRHWTDWDAITDELSRLAEINPDIIVVHGDASGADRIAGAIAATLGLTVKAYPAEWAVYGKEAGPIRNRQMLAQEQPDLVLAFHGDLSKSRGTAHMVRIAKKAGVPVKLIGGVNTDAAV